MTRALSVTIALLLCAVIWIPVLRELDRGIRLAIAYAGLPAVGILPSFWWFAVAFITGAIARAVTLDTGFTANHKDEWPPLYRMYLEFAARSIMLAVFCGLLQWRYA